MISAYLKTRFAAALEGLADDVPAALELIRPGQDAKFGDFQANMAMPIGKKTGKPPREIAQAIVARLRIDDLCKEPEIAGPGFINLRLREETLETLLQKCVADTERLGVAVVEPAHRRRILVDFSGPNIAKQMHVGHIRSTVIGNALQRMLRFAGHEVITDNHIGDWGTPFGMIIYGYRHFLDRTAYENNPLEELGRLYRLVRRLIDLAGKPAGTPSAKPTVSDDAGAAPDTDSSDPDSSDPDASSFREQFQEYLDRDIQAAVLEEVAKLHQGDTENRTLWQEIVDHCLVDIDRMYRRLNVSFDHTLGESFYQPMLAPTVESLLERGIARETDGAVGVFFEGEEVPMLIRKKDGAFLYGTTDVATVDYRMERWQPDAILYVVDFRQALHFQHLFATMRLMGYGADRLELAHVKFGTVLGEDGKPFKTRSGDTVGLESLLDEAQERALAVVQANLSPENEGNDPSEKERSEQEHRETARRIGIGALIYADLSQNRESDYVFSYDKMLAMNGNTATYMQYAYARVRGIFLKGGVDIDALRKSGIAIRIREPQERALALELLRFDEALDWALRDYRPNILTAYLFELANRYSNFFEHCPVLKAADEETKISRLLLCDLTARTIRKGLELLGIETVERM
ncbi:MAG TPA: arginine--tRNA ligase [Planctomycetaceae bacterium]|nr:arginine--tRNA ligase [Planctomycetaceae bacterium]